MGSETSVVATQYRLRQVRRACLQTFPGEQLPGQIVPVDQRLLAGGPSCTTSIEPGLYICFRDYKIHVTKATPPDLLSMVIEVIRDAQ